MESVARPLRFILLAFLNHLFGKKETVGVTPPTLAPTIAFLFHLRGCGKFEYVEIRHILALWLLTYDVYRHVSCRHIKSKKDRLCSILADSSPSRPFLPHEHFCRGDTSLRLSDYVILASNLPWTFPPLNKIPTDLTVVCKATMKWLNPTLCIDPVYPWVSAHFLWA